VGNSRRQKQREGETEKGIRGERLAEGEGRDKENRGERARARGDVREEE
jgi:hypothetical protein